MSAKAKPKRLRGRDEDLVVPRTTLRIGGATITVLDSGPEREATDNGKIPRRRNSAKKTTKKTKTANELMLEAWKYSWENRHKRLTKP